MDDLQRLRAYIVFPRDFVWGRAGLHFAVEVDVIPFLDVGRVEVASKNEGRAGNVVDLKLPRVLHCRVRDACGKKRGSFRTGFSLKHLGIEKDSLGGIFNVS